MQVIQLPGRPLRSIAVFPVVRMFCIQFLNLSEKPLIANILSKDVQDMESKAFLKSSLMIIVGSFLVWQEFVRSAAKTKFSAKFLPEMKPVWLP